VNQDNVNKLVIWIKANLGYSPEQLKQSALSGGASEVDFNAAWTEANQSSGLPAPAAPQLTYIGVGRRWAAFIIDMFVFAFVFGLMEVLFSGGNKYGCNSGFYLGATFTLNGHKSFSGLCGFPAFLMDLIVVGYYILTEWKLGGTLGKLALSIRVTKPDGGAIDIKASIVRNLLRIVDFLPFSYLVGCILIWNSKTRQRFGDKMANTVVVSASGLKQS
jgi:uncharacterized RDD family membrane protein YckC